MNPRLRLPLRVGRPVPSDSDERLAELARHGSSAAFDALVARHRRALVAECARVVGPADAEEAVQEALIRAHMRLASGQPVHAPGAWLRLIARRTALNLLRARAARPTTCEGDLERLAAPDDAPERRRRLAELVDAVAALPERQRDAIVMRELEGRSYEEIGARLGASDGAVRQLLSRARGTLRTRLGTLAGVEPLVRLAFSGGAARVGALSGAGVLSIKLGGALFFPGVAVTPHPARAAAAAPIARRAAAPRPGSGTGRAAVTTAAPGTATAGASAGAPVVSGASVVYRPGSAVATPVVLVRRPAGSASYGARDPRATATTRHARTVAASAPAGRHTVSRPRTSTVSFGCDRALSGSSRATAADGAPSGTSTPATSTSATASPVTAMRTSTRATSDPAAPDAGLRAGQ